MRLIEDTMLIIKGPFIMERPKSADSVPCLEVSMAGINRLKVTAHIVLAVFGMTLICGFISPLLAQELGRVPYPPAKTFPLKDSKPEPYPIKKLGNGLVSIGNIVVDTNKKEVTVPGRMQRDQTMEFLATQKGGSKSYESVMELDTNATSFNLALIMIGLQKTNASVPTQHFDSKPVAGDPVEIWVEWKNGGAVLKMRAEDMLYDLRTKEVPPMGAWVYTGSTVLPDGRFRAEMDGVLIGFVHDPASIIENATGSGLNAYGSIKLNPNLKILPDTPLKLTVKALPKQK
jgi:hypothetical protein